MSRKRKEPAFNLGFDIEKVDFGFNIEDVDFPIFECEAATMSNEPLKNQEQ